MHTLREIIQHTIQENAGDPAAAAVEVCLQLERLVGLYGNGWFDNDALMLTHLEAKADGVVGQQAEPVLPPDAISALLENRNATRAAYAETLLNGMFGEEPNLAEKGRDDE